MPLVGTDMPKKAARARQVRDLALTAQVEADQVVRAKTARENETGRRLAVEAARVLQGDHCEDVVVLDLRGVSPVCDFFVIATGTSDRQMRAACDHVEDAGRTFGERAYGLDGYEEGVWMVLDYVDVVIHLFDQERRSYYDLESLWGDCPRVAWASP